MACGCRQRGTRPTEFAPKNYHYRPEAALLAIQYGAEVGISPLRALNCIIVVNGKVGLEVRMEHALAQKNPLYLGISPATEVGGKMPGPEVPLKDWPDDFGISVTVYRQGCQPHTQAFTVAHARRARLWAKGGAWSDYPWRMLWNRALGFCLDDVFADSLHGLTGSEAAMDWPGDDKVKVKEIPGESSLLANSGYKVVVLDEADQPADDAGNEVEEHRSGAAPRQRIEDAATEFLGSGEGEPRPVDSEYLDLVHRAAIKGVPADDILPAPPAKCPVSQVSAAIVKLKKRLK